MSDRAFYKVGSTNHFNKMEAIMQSVESVIGIDVSKAKLDICALFEDKTRKKVVENSESGFKQLHDWISKNNIEYPHICMESTGCYSEGVAEFFLQSWI